MVRFCRLLGFHQDFQSPKLLQLPKMGIFVEKCRILSMKEMSNDVLILREVKRNIWVGVCGLGLTRAAVVVVDIWGEVSPHRGIRWRFQWGEWYGAPRSDGMAV